MTFFRQKFPAVWKTMDIEYLTGLAHPACLLWPIWATYWLEKDSQLEPSANIIVSAAARRSILVGGGRAPAPKKSAVAQLGGEIL